MTNIFEGMTNLYSLSKTLRFELRPDPKTKEHLQSSGILARDTQRDIDYNIIKPLFDKLHDRFIRESLQDVDSIDWEDFIVTYNAFRAKVKSGGLTDKEKKDFQKDLDSRMLKIRKQIVEQFSKTATKWKQNPHRQETKKEKTESFLKENGYKILTEQGILKVLEKEYYEKQELQTIKNFHGFFSYFTGFNQNRENYYSDESKSTAVAYRIVDQNLLTFATNCTFKENIITIAQDAGITAAELQIFNPNYYNYCLHQDGIDKYNTILGGEKDKHGIRVTDGINVKINLYNQNPKYNKQQGFKKVPQLKQLYKQIGSLKEKTIPFTLIQNDGELKETIDNLIIQADKKQPEIKHLLSRLRDGLDLDYNKIRLSKTALNHISNRYFASWDLLQEKAVEHNIFTYKKNNEDPYTIPAYISLEQLKQLLENIIVPQSEDTDKQQYLFKRHLELDHQGKSLRNGIHNNWTYFLIILQREFEKLLSKDETVVDQEKTDVSYRFLGYQQARDAYLAINNFDKNNKEHKDTMKQLADSALALLQFFKLFRIDEHKLDGKEYDMDRYAQFDEILADYPLTKRYDAIRNYLTKKPFSEEKMKLNFDSSYLMTGRASDFGTSESLILKKGDQYYLAIVHGKGISIQERGNLIENITNENSIKKMVLKVQKPDNKNTPRLFVRSKGTNYAPAVTELGLPIDDIIEIYDKKRFSPDKKNPNAHRPHLIKLIDYFKLGFSKHPSYKDFTFVWKDSKDYDNIAQFYEDVMNSCYILDWENINFNYLKENLIETGKVLIFEIYSKDFGKKSFGTKNLQTLYWNNTFQKGSNIKLLGGAEVFRRKKSITKEKKQLKKDNFDVYKNNRYTEDKILFHVPITLGFGNKGGGKFNEQFNKQITLPHHQDMHIIGVDRGEKHLAFYSVISVKTGKIVEQGTLNIVGPVGKEVDYEAKLREKADTRLAARQNRDVIGNIKNLKEGYISQVVKKITDLMIRYNAVVVFEDLNGGFKNSRKKIEHSVYQKLELALVKKLNFLADKHTPNGNTGSVTNPYQLTPSVNTFGDIKGKQRGAVFYTRANYTSQTDPVTGRRKTIYLKKTKVEELKNEIFEKFSEIGFDGKDYYFKYMTNKIDKEWTLFSGKDGKSLDRYRGKRDNKNIWQIELQDIVKILNDVFDNPIDKRIFTIHDVENPKVSSLKFAIDLIQQIRNSGPKDKDGKPTKDDDFLLSPVRDNHGNHFDSRKSGDEEKGGMSPKFPTSGDANGAYNIARKGLMMLQRIKNNSEKLYISDDDWDMWLQNN